MKAYRFLSADYAIAAIESGLLKVGRIKELNDPSDCAPFLFDLPPAEQDRPTYVLDQVIDQASESHGVICYSAAVDDPVIWSHYGNKHSGVALGFEIQESSTVREVSYSIERPKMSIYDRGTTGEFGMLESAVFFTKAQSWFYEKEVRSVVLLDQCIPRAGMYFWKYDAASLTDVIVGSRCPVEKRYFWNLCAASGLSHIVVRQAVNLSNEYKINIC